MKQLFALLILSLSLFSCRPPDDPCNTTDPIDQSQLDSSIYRAGIQYAMYPEEFKVYYELVAITKENHALTWKIIDGEDYVLMLSWTRDSSYYNRYLDSAFYDTKQYEIWVTASPELHKRMQNESYEDNNRRLLQLLGLPPNGTYSYFVEFWVRPADLFRPCADPEITDKRCETCLSNYPDTAYQMWFNATRISRYYPCELYKQYPWTALGYTYDWHPDNLKHVGLSEFVIRKHAEVKVKKIYTTQEYLRSHIH
jgi:hypothetical protein